MLLIIIIILLQFLKFCHLNYVSDHCVVAADIAHWRLYRNQSTEYNLIIGRTVHG